MKIKFENGKFFMDGSLIIEKQQLLAPIPEHTHEFIEIVYILKGRCTQKIDDTEYPANRGDLFLINYNRTHSVMGENNCEFFNILVKPEFINKSLTDSRNAFSLLELSSFEEFCGISEQNKCMVTFSGGEVKNVEAIINLLWKEFKENEAGCRFAIQSGLNFLLVQIFRKLSFPFKSTQKEISSELLKYIKEHSKDRISLKDIASANYYNPSYFSRLFKQYTGKSFTQYLKEARIEHACLLLETTDMNINDISEEAGYSDKTKFYKHFRQIKELSPYEYKVMKKSKK